MNRCWLDLYRNLEWRLKDVCWVSKGFVVGFLRVLERCLKDSGKVERIWDRLLEGFGNVLKVSLSVFGILSDDFGRVSTRIL